MLKILGVAPNMTHSMLSKKYKNAPIRGHKQKLTVFENIHHSPNSKAHYELKK